MHGNIPTKVDFLTEKINAFHLLQKGKKKRKNKIFTKTKELQKLRTFDTEEICIKMNENVRGGKWGDALFFLLDV